MAITTYSELQAAAANWLARGDLAARIPEFIALAEAKLGRSLRLRQMIGREVFEVATAFVPLPADFLEIRSLTLGAEGAAWRLQPATVEALADWSAASPSTGAPRSFALVGADLQLHPPPDRTYAAAMTFFRRLPRLSDASPGNWLLAQAPDVYLYATLLEAAPFLRDGEALATWRTLLDEAVSLLGGSGRAPAAALRTEIPSATADGRRATDRSVG